MVLEKILGSSRRNLYVLAVLFLSMAFIPQVGPTVLGLLNWQIVGPINVGLVVAVLGLDLAFELYRRRV